MSNPVRNHHQEQKPFPVGTVVKYSQRYIDRMAEDYQSPGFQRLIKVLSAEELESRNQANREWRAEVVGHFGDKVYYKNGTTGNQSGYCFFSCLEVDSSKEPI